MKAYTFGLAEATSQLLNAVLGGNPNITVSARCYINREKKGWDAAYKVINKVFFWQEDHCKESFDDDIKYAMEVQRYVESNR